MNDILKDYQENVFKAQSAKAAAILNKQQAQIVIDSEDVSYISNLAATYASDIAAKNQEDFDQFARDVALGDYKKYGNLDYLLTEEEKYYGQNLESSEAFQKLFDHGQELLAFDAAIEAFTDSLLSNALMISDVSEDQKTNMMNFFNSDQVESMLEIEKTNLKVMDEDNWEKQKAI